MLPTYTTTAKCFQLLKNTISRLLMNGHINDQIKNSCYIMCIKNWGLLKLSRGSLWRRREIMIKL